MPEFFFRSICKGSQIVGDFSTLLYYFCVSGCVLQFWPQFFLGIGLTGYTTREDPSSLAIGLRTESETGEVLLAQSADGNASMSNVSATLTTGTRDFSSAVAENTPLGKATRQAIEKVVSAATKTMKGQRWSGRVMDACGHHIYINAGTPE